MSRRGGTLNRGFWTPERIQEFHTLMLRYPTNKAQGFRAFADTCNKSTDSISWAYYNHRVVKEYFEANPIHRIISTEASGLPNVKNDANNENSPFGNKTTYGWKNEWQLIDANTMEITLPDANFKKTKIIIRGDNLSFTITNL